MGCRLRWIPAVAVAALIVAACGGGGRRSAASSATTSATDLGTTALQPDNTAAAVDPGACAQPGDVARGCALPGYPDRPFDVAVPAAPGPWPLLVVLHGGSGNSTNAESGSCLDGDPDAPNCWTNLARSEGFLAVFPNGTGPPRRPDSRTWNAGGGGPDYACTSGYACRTGVDDVAYLGVLLDEVEAQYPVDATRVYVTGFSNGAAMAHRVGCEMADRVAAIAPVSGGNQFAAVAPCEPARPVSVLEVHGTADPCWTYERSTRACLEQDPRPKVGARESTLGWVERLGCVAEPEVTAMPDVVDDGMTTTVETWTGCAGEVEVRLMTIDGGGHVFPSGSAALPRVVGDPTLDWGSEEIWAFLSRFTR